MEDAGSGGVRAYVFIETRPDMTWSVVNSLKKKKCIRQVDAINGPYSVIAVVEGDNPSLVAVVVLTGIRKMEGVSDMVVYLAEHNVERTDIPESPRRGPVKKLLKK